MSGISIFIFFILGIIVRFYKLTQIPFALYHDEMDYVFAGEAVARFGSDITGQWRPWQLLPLKTLNYTAELPALFHAIAQNIFGFGPSSGHMPAAIFGIVTALFVGILVYLFSKKYLLSVLASLVVLVNPWHVHLSRMGYEAVISLFFQLLFLISLFQIGSAKKRKLLANVLLYLLLFASLFFTYFTYHGAKFLSVALVMGASFWFFWQKKPLWQKFVLSLSLIFFLSILLLSTWRLQQAGQFGLRDSELINSSYISQLVDQQRKSSVANWANQLFINKPTILVRELLARYLFVFDPYRLVVTGYESGFQFSLIVHGFFYLSSIPLLLFGIKWWFKNYKRPAYFLLIFLLISPIASTITIGYQSIFRSALTYLILLIFIAGGIFAVFQYLTKLPKAKQLLSVFILFLLLEVANFTFVYLSRYGFVSADNHYFYEKLLASYVNRIDQPVLILTGKGKAYSLARSIVAYNQLMPQLSETEKKQFRQTSGVDYHLQELVISESCPNPLEVLDNIQVVDLDMFERCQYADFIATASAQFKYDVDDKFLSISSPIDSGAYYFLLNDPLCDKEQLAFFVYTNQLADFSPDRMTDDNFCQTWIKREN